RLTPLGRQPFLSAATKRHGIVMPNRGVPRLSINFRSFSTPTCTRLSAMFEDVIDMRDFYRTSLGQATSRTLRRQIRALWPDVSGLAVMGFGFATPYLRQFRSEAERVIACMPAAQGVLRWPPEAANQVLLADEAELPLPDMSCDRSPRVPALDRGGQLRPRLCELWCAAAGRGRGLAIVPYRRRSWTRI